MFAYILKQSIFNCIFNLITTINRLLYSHPFLFSNLFCSSKFYFIVVHFSLFRECTWPSRVAYVRFEDSRDAQISLHLMNTVFIDRAIIITIVDDGIAFIFFIV